MLQPNEFVRILGLGLGHSVRGARIKKDHEEHQRIHQEHCEPESPQLQLRWQQKDIAVRFDKRRQNFEEGVVVSDAGELDDRDIRSIDGSSRKRKNTAMSPIVISTKNSTMPERKAPSSHELDPVRKMQSVRALIANAKMATLE